MKIQSLLILFLVCSTPLWGDSDNSFHTERDSLNVRLVGSWPAGAAYAVTIDDEREIAYVAAYGTSDSLFILDISDASNPERLSTLSTGGWWRQGLCHKDRLLYVDGSPRLQIVSVEDPRNPLLVGEYIHHGAAAQWITVEDTIAYVSRDMQSGFGFIEVLSVSDPSNPRFLGRTEPDFGTPWQIVIEDTLAYVASEYVGLRILSVSDPSNPYEVGIYPTEDVTIGVALRDSLAYLADSWDIEIVSITDPSHPTEAGRFYTSGYPTNLAINDHLVYLADGSGGFRVISILDPINPEEVGHYPTQGYAWGVTYSEPYAYVTTDEEGLLIFEYYDPTIIGDEADERMSVPKAFSLSQNYPNPFNPSTTIEYKIPGANLVHAYLRVYDLRGRLVKILVDDKKESGNYSVHWDGRDERGKEVGSGVFLYNIKAGEFSSTKKMVILR